MTVLPTPSHLTYDATRNRLTLNDPLLSIPGDRSPVRRSGGPPGSGALSESRAGSCSISIALECCRTCRSLLGTGLRH